MEKMWTGGTKEEYETQHFGFSSQTMQLSLRRMIKSSIITSVKDMDNHLQQTINLNDSDKEALTRACDKLSRLFLSRISEPLKAIDEEVESMFTIPANVLLPEDEDQIETTKSEYNEIINEVEELRRRVKRAALMETLLRNELSDLESLDKYIEVANKGIEMVDNWTKKIQDCPTKRLVKETDVLCSTTPMMNGTDELECYFGHK